MLLAAWEKSVAKRIVRKTGKESLCSDMLHPPRRIRNNDDYEEQGRAASRSTETPHHSHPPRSENDAQRVRISLSTRIRASNTEAYWLTLKPQLMGEYPTSFPWQHVWRCPRIPGTPPNRYYPIIFTYSQTLILRFSIYSRFTNII